MPIGEVDQIRGEHRGAIELAGLDTYPDLEEMSEGTAEWALREAELVGPAHRLQQLGLGAADISADNLVETEDAQRHGDRIGWREPHRIDFTPAAANSAVALESAHLQSEFAMQPRQYAQAGFEYGPEELPPFVEARLKDSNTWVARRKSPRAK